MARTLHPFLACATQKSLLVPRMSQNVIYITQEA
jgi:hypothetical protein